MKIYTDRFYIGTPEGIIKKCGTRAEALVYAIEFAKQYEKLYVEDREAKLAGWPTLWAIDDCGKLQVISRK